MKKLISYLTLTALLLCSLPDLAAQEAAAPAPRDPTLEERVKDIEQYFNNLAPGTAATETDPGVKSHIAVAGPGHNAFLMVCAALVLFMTLPGLALFYGGLVRRKNVLSVLAQCLGIGGLVTILWFVCGYSLVFGEGSGPLIGNLKYLFLNGVTGAPNPNYTAWPSHAVFSMYQLMFAIITPALIVGAIAERMKFSALLLFIGLWMFVVYFPLAHMVWGFDGLMNGVWNGSAKITAIDFAGGTVVHMSSGWSALVLCLILGPRLGFGKEKMAPHSMVLCMVGTGMLWVGWYGFNAGSALAADGIAAQAFMTTTLAAAVASFVWGLMEKVMHGTMSVLGLCSGAVAGLVVITPAAGFVTAQSAVIIGIIAGVIPYLACTKLKGLLKYDDALDTFGVHAVGGTVGALVTGIFADASVNGNLLGAYAQANGLAVKVGEAFVLNRTGLIMGQVKAILITIVLSTVATAVLAWVVKMTLSLRPTPEVETNGLDLADHGEEGYIG
jgi:Amt family ammonium transporter